VFAGLTLDTRLVLVGAQSGLLLVALSLVPGFVLLNDLLAEKNEAML
jgi:hypothetical protein